VALHFKSFVQILMAVLALGMVDPQAACAAGMAEPGKICCCTHSPVRKCHAGTPCKKSCPLVQAQAPLNKQLPRAALLATPHESAFLFAIAWANVSYPVFVPVIHQRESDASPPLGGKPAQAVLRLWLI
jgi:hypothetical protein